MPINKLIPLLERRFSDWATHVAPAMHARVEAAPVREEFLSCAEPQLKRIMRKADYRNGIIKLLGIPSKREEKLDRLKPDLSHAIYLLNRDQVQIDLGSLRRFSQLVESMVPPDKKTKARGKRKK